MPSERARQWGWNMRNCRLALGLTQEQVAEGVKVRQSTVARWERGELTPRDDMKLRIAAVLHQDVRMLFPLFQAAAS